MYLISLIYAQKVIVPLTQMTVFPWHMSMTYLIVEVVELKAISIQHSREIRQSTSPERGQGVRLQKRYTYGFRDG
jgi:hypothetical protein